MLRLEYCVELRGIVKGIEDDSANEFRGGFPNGWLDFRVGVEILRECFSSETPDLEVDEDILRNWF